MRLRQLLPIALLMAAAPLYAGQDFRTRVNNEVIDVEDLVEDVKAELAFGRELAARILGMHPIQRDQALRRYINLVGTAVAVHGSRSEIDYQFAVLDTEEVNAYAAPGA